MNRPRTFWCDNCDEWTEVEDVDWGSFWCERCAEHYHCGDCGYEIDRAGNCLRPRGCDHDGCEDPITYRDVNHHLCDKHYTAALEAQGGAR